MSVKDYGTKATVMELNLSEVRINYMMRNPTTFLYVELYYDQDGKFGGGDILPESINTKGKIYVAIYDNRDVFSYQSGLVLLDEFKKQLRKYTLSSISMPRIWTMISWLNSIAEKRFLWVTSTKANITYGRNKKVREKTPLIT